MSGAPRDEDLDLEILEALAGESTPAPGVRTRLLQAVGTGAARFDGYLRRLERLFDVDPATAKKVVAAIDAPEGWVPYVDGVTLLHFQGGASLGECDAGLVRFPKGLAYAKHRHAGPEVMFILQGALTDDPSGKVLFAGDLLEMPAGSEHGFRIHDGEDCIAAVLLYGGFPEFV